MFVYLWINLLPAGTGSGIPVLVSHGSLTDPGQPFWGSITCRYRCRFTWPAPVISSRRNTLHKSQYETSISRTTRTSTTRKGIPVKSRMTQTSSWNEHRRRFLKRSIENTASKHYAISRHQHRGYKNENELVMVLTVLINAVKTWGKNRDSESYRIK